MLRSYSFRPLSPSLTSSDTWFSKDSLSLFQDQYVPDLPNLGSLTTCTPCSLAQVWGSTVKKGLGNPYRLHTGMSCSSQMSGHFLKSSTAKGGS